jgi:hypothetical protein
LRSSIAHGGPKRPLVHCGRSRRQDREAASHYVKTGSHGKKAYSAKAMGEGFKPLWHH